MASLVDKEKAGKKLAKILDKIHNSNTDIALLAEYHKLYKKEIPFFRRSWAAAWLFMQFDRGMSSDSFKDNNSSNFSDNAVLLEGESKRIFISIGKNRRLFPKELAALISSNTSAAREDIGSIRILDNYSFVQVRDTKADEIINSLNGFLFRERTLTVNYAKAKE